MPKPISREMKLRILHHQVRGLARNADMAGANPQRTKVIMEKVAKELRKTIRNEFGEY